MNFRALTALCLLALALGGIGLQGCVKSLDPNNNPTPTQTITQIINTATNLTIMQTALARTHLDVTLSGTGPFTIFIPTDGAFANAGIDSTAISKLSDSALSAFVLYSVLNGSYPSTSLPAGPNAGMQTANQDSIFVTNTGGGGAIYVNGNGLAVTDLVASNGIIHSITQPLIPPVGNIIKTIQQDTIFSYLAAAFSRADQGASEVSANFSASGRTLFAPTNNAFRAAGFATIDDINNSKPDSLANILLYHGIGIRLFGRDLANGGSTRALNDSVLTVFPGSVITIKGNKNTTPADIVGFNLVATNGVIQVIDQVLLP